MASFASSLPFNDADSDHASRAHSRGNDNHNHNRNHNRERHQNPNANSNNNRSQSRSRSKSINRNLHCLKDQRCNVCKRWCIDPKDFKDNFISCTCCVHSYHKKCILHPHKFQNSLSLPTCSRIQNRSNPKSSNQCNNDKSKELLIEYVDNDVFELTNYVYDEENEPIYYSPHSKKLKTQLFHSQNITKQTKLSFN